MANNTYNISRVADGSSFQYNFEPRAFKGVVDITINFSFTTTTYEVVKLRVATSNGNEVWFEKSIPINYKCTMYPSVGEYVKRNWITVTAVYSNFKSAEYFLPIYVAQPSYYTNFDGAVVANAQFIDSGDNGDMFIVLQNNKGDLYNMLLLANQHTMQSALTSEADLLAAVSAVDVPNIVNPIATDVDENVRVVHNTEAT